jgi:hypothetical protein
MIGIRGSCEAIMCRHKANNLTYIIEKIKLDPDVDVDEISALWNTLSRVQAEVWQDYFIRHWL